MGTFCFFWRGPTWSSILSITSRLYGTSLTEVLRVRIMGRLRRTERGCSIKLETLDQGWRPESDGDRTWRTVKFRLREDYDRLRTRREEKEEFYRLTSPFSGVGVRRLSVGRVCVDGFCDWLETGPTPKNKYNVIKGVLRPGGTRRWYWGVTVHF